MGDLVSVIVPVYMVESYIYRCIDSILNQTYRNLEIILVDDGSPDQCPEICDDYAKKDSRVRVIHKQNGGLSDARNVGIEIASGNYITFVDSDDYIHPQYVELLMQPFSDGDCSISISCCNYLIGTESVAFHNQISQVQKPIYYVGKHALYQSEYRTVAWAKIYKLELFNDIRYPFGKIFEDEATTYKLFFKAAKVAFIKPKLYYYYQSKSSIVRSKFTLKKLDIISAVEDKLEFIKANNEMELYQLECRRYCYLLLKNYYYCKKKLPDSKDIRKELFIKYKRTYKSILTAKKIEIKSKVLIIFCRINPNIFGVVKGKYL